MVEYTYDAYGNLLTTSDTSGVSLGVNNPFRYRGYYYDVETGLYYLNSRYYNPHLGRFINADSYGGSTGALLSHNVFAYCSNNPIMRSDSSGHFWYYGNTQYSDSTSFREAELEPIRKLIESSLKKTFSNYKPGTLKFMFDGVSHRRYTSQFGADLVNIGRSAILDLPFYAAGFGLAGAFKIGKHATDGAKIANSIIKGGTSVGVGLFGSSIVGEFVNVQKEVEGWTETFYVMTEFNYGQQPIEAVVHDNGDVECYYFNIQKCF